MIGAHASKVRPGGFQKKKHCPGNFRDVKEACREFFNKRIKVVKAEWGADFPR
jgi:hypothetical protein